MTHRQVGHWVTSLSLFEHAIKVDPNNYVAYNNAGIAYSDVGLIDKAFEEYQTAVKLRPKFTEGQFNLALAYALKGKEKEAIEHFCNVLNYGNSAKILAKTHNNVGAIMFKQNNYEEAQLHFVEAIRSLSDFIDPYNNLGVLLYTAR
ncbi:MAG: tetratricopeptide repeat protein [Pyrinomonadaceae bacterium]